MTETPISRFPVVPLADLPPDLRERFAEVADRSGFLLLAMQHRLGDRVRQRQRPLIF